MKRNIIAIVVGITFVFYACAPTSSLQKTTSNYQITYPEKSKLLVESNLLKENDPIIKATIYRDYLSNKVYTNHYETLRKDKKLTQVLVGLGLIGVSAGLAVALDNAKGSNDTTKLALLTIGAIGSGAGGIYLLAAPTKKDLWTTDSIDYEDTIYAFKNTVKSKQITLKSEDNVSAYYLDTDNEGQVSIDIRNFCKNLPKVCSITISVSDFRQTTPAVIKIEEKFVSKILKNEHDAENLLVQANSKVKEKKFIEANSLLTELVSKYPFTKSIETSETLMKNIVGNIKEEKLEYVRKNFRAVSANKVPEAFDNAGITPNELNEIGYMIERMTRSNMVKVIVNGLGMDLERYLAENEFNALNNPQKIYAVIAASENISNRHSLPKWEILKVSLGIDEGIAKKVAKIESGKLLVK